MHLITPHLYERCGAARSFDSAWLKRDGLRTCQGRVEKG
jgi:hypothetical protein